MLQVIRFGICLRSQVDGTELKKDKKSTISQKKGWKTKKQKGRGKDATKAD